MSEPEPATVDKLGAIFILSVTTCLSAASVGYAIWKVAQWIA